MFITRRQNTFEGRGEGDSPPFSFVLMASDMVSALRIKDRGMDPEVMLELLDHLLLPRLIEEKMLSLLRQGRISKWFSGMGQEAISVGCAAAMEADEFILPMHRNLGVFTTRGVELERLFAQFQGKESGFTQGHDRSFHFGSKEHHIVGMISHLGPQLGIADGIALASLNRKEGKATLVFTGDGATSEGDFHEALNVASVWQLPVIFCIESNHWGLSTPSSQQFRCAQFIDKAAGYGIPEEDALRVEGNDILTVFQTVQNAARSIRKKPRPILIEFDTFRRRGHEEASGTKYYPEGLIEAWEKRDPVEAYIDFLTQEGHISSERVDQRKTLLKQQISDALKKAEAEPEVQADENREMARLFQPEALELRAASETTEELRFIDAITAGLRAAMERHDNLVLMGQDIGTYGGVFKVTDGFIDQFGEERVRNTPLCESAIIGSGLGLSIAGMKAMVEMQFADFVTCGFNQIVNNLAKLHWRWGQNADVVVRMPTGAGVAAGPFHSQSNEAWFFHVPGLMIAYPAFPDDAKGLLARAFDTPNPVLFFEHKALYRSLSGEVPTNDYSLPFGQARLHGMARDAVIVTYGMGVHWALAEQERLRESGTEIGVLDLRTLSPLDWPSVFDAANTAGRVLVLHEDNLTGGIGGELVARIQADCFEQLDAPVMRVASLDTPIPFAPNLEEGYLPKNRLPGALDALLEY
jgi:2-oxoisovalerate dehydrogenase E1 component